MLVAVYRDTGRVNLHEAGISEHGSTFVGLPCGTSVTAHRIGGQEEYIPITTGSQYNCVCSITFELSGYQVAGNDTACLAVDNYDIKYFMAVVHFYFAGVDLAVQGAVCTQQQLLSGLTAGIEGTAYQCTTERAVCQQTSVFTGKGHTLCDTLVDNGITYLCQTVNIGFTGTVVSSFNGFIEQAEYRVIVIGIVFGCIDTSLCGDRVCAARGILIAECSYIVS